MLPVERDVIKQDVGGGLPPSRPRLGQPLLPPTPVPPKEDRMRTQFLPGVTPDYVEFSIERLQSHEILLHLLAQTEEDNSQLRIVLLLPPHRNARPTRCVVHLENTRTASLASPVGMHPGTRST